MCKKGGRKSLVTAYLYTVSNTFLAPVKLCYVYIGATKIYTSRPPLNPFSVQQAVRSPCLVKWWGPKLGHVFGGETICIESSYCRMGLKSTHKVTKLYSVHYWWLPYSFHLWWPVLGELIPWWWSMSGFKTIMYMVWLDVRYITWLSRTIRKIPPIYGHTSVKQQSILLYTKCPA